MYGFGLNLSAVSGYFPYFKRLTVKDCCRIATITVIADKITRLTDIRPKNARLCGYGTPHSGPTSRV